MDDWDPKLTSGFAAEREVILFDNAGDTVRWIIGDTESGACATREGPHPSRRALTYTAPRGWRSVANVRLSLIDLYGKRGTPSRLRSGDTMDERAAMSLIDTRRDQ